MEEMVSDVNKVVVEVYLDFSEESDKALRVLFNVAEKLLDAYGIWVEIVPIHLWFNDPIEAEGADLPKIFINGKLRFIGRAPTEKEALSAIMERVGATPAKSEGGAVESIKFFDGGFSEAVLAVD